MNTTVEYCFVKILQDHTILRWKANDFWQTLLSYGVANTFPNRQKLYRLLYKKYMKMCWLSMSIQKTSSCPATQN